MNGCLQPSAGGVLWWPELTKTLVMTLTMIMQDVTVGEGPCPFFCNFP